MHIEWENVRFQKLTRSKHCAAAALLDEVLLSRALSFSSQQLGLLMKTVTFGKEKELEEAAAADPG